MNDIKIPTADEMAEKSKSILNEAVENILARVIKRLDAADGFNTTVMLKESEDKLSGLIIDKLKSLGYKVDYTTGYFEDRPCGGYVSGKLHLDWSPI